MTGNPDIESLIQAITKPLTAHVTSLTEKAEEGFQSVVSSFPTGNIQLNNQNHVEKLIQAMYLFRTVMAPDQVAKGEPLFKAFSATDQAFLLNMHFEVFKAMKPNTVQVRIKEAVDRLHHKNPKAIKLTQALQEFFYL